MERLRSRDLRTLLAFLRDLYTLRTPGALMAHVVPALRRVIPADRSAYSDMDLRRRAIVDVTDPPLTKASRPVFARHMREHPLVDYYRRTGDPAAHHLRYRTTRNLAIDARSQLPCGFLCNGHTCTINDAVRTFFVRQVVSPKIMAFRASVASFEAFAPALRAAIFAAPSVVNSVVEFLANARESRGNSGKSLEK